jgi:hypothetical protein
VLLSAAVLDLALFPFLLALGTSLRVFSLSFQFLANIFQR